MSVRGKILAALKTCSSSGDLESGKSVHAAVVRIGHESDIYLASSLVSMYAKCGSLSGAGQVFEGMACPDVVSWNALMLGFADNSQGSFALELLARMTAESGMPNDRTFVAAVKACSNLATEEEGRPVNGMFVKLSSITKGMAINSWAAKCGCDCDRFVSNTLVDMYSKCGSMLDARRIFDMMPYHDIVGYTALILGYAENAEEDLALKLFAGIQCPPNAFTYVAALKACTALATKEEAREVDRELVRSQSLMKGMAMHSEAVKYQQDSSILVSNTLVDMYVKCGSLLDARAVFDCMACWSAVSWTALMLGYVENGKAGLALELFACMDSPPSSRTFVAALKACTSLAAQEVGTELDGKLVKLNSLNTGIDIHCRALGNSCDSDIFVANSLVVMYAACGRLGDAQKVFDSMLQRTAVSWNVLIMGYADNGEQELALELFSQMRRSKDCLPDAITFLAAIKACGGLALKEEAEGRMVKIVSLVRGMEVHYAAEERGFVSDISVANALMDMYCKCGSLTDARKVFDNIPCPSLVSWTVLMTGHVDNGEGELALEMFELMRCRGSPLIDALVLVAAIKACASLTEKEKVEQRGMDIHKVAVESGYGADFLVMTSLIDMYAKSGNLSNARAAFDAIPYRSLTLWNSLILGYAEYGEENAALRLFWSMELEGYVPDAKTLVAALKACSSMAAKEDGKLVDGKLVKVESLDRGMALHSRAVVSGWFDWDIFVPNSVMDMYAKCGSMLDLSMAFTSMPWHDVVSWTSLIWGFTNNGEAELGLELLKCMQEQGCIPNVPSLVVGLKACGNMVALEAAKDIHGRICRSGLEGNSIIEICLLDVYGKCASTANALQVFESLSAAKGNSVAWNTLIAGYGRQGDSVEVLYWFDRMRKEGMHMDGVTFVNVLAACSHAGLIEDGSAYLHMMCSRFGISPCPEHYNCTIDMLSRANRLDQAMDMIQKMPLEPNAVTWTSVLNACRKWEDVQVARLAFESLVKLDKVESSAFVLMSNTVRI